MTPQERKEKFNSLLGEASAAEEAEKYYLAIVKFTEAFEYNDEPSNEYYYYLLVSTWYIRLGNLGKALSILDKGIEKTHAPNLMLMKCEILVEQKSDTEGAIQLLDEAKEFFDNNAQALTPPDTDKIKKRFNTIHSLLKEEIEFKNRLYELKTMCFFMNHQKQYEKSLKDITAKIELERVKNIELLTIFTAIISLSIIGGQIVIETGYPNALRLISALGAILIGFASLLSLLLHRDVRNLWDVIFNIRGWMIVLSTSLVLYLINESSINSTVALYLSSF